MFVLEFAKLFKFKCMCVVELPIRPEFFLQKDEQLKEK